MARDIFVQTVLRRYTFVDNDLNIRVGTEPLDEITVEVFKAGTSTIATIYQDRIGAAEGPATATGAVGNNPFTTGDSGMVVFWAEPGEYDVRFTDNNVVPARIDQYTIGFEALNPLTVLDGLETTVPIGGQLPYVGSVDPPGGRFLLCDGRPVSSALYPTLDAMIGEAATGANKHRYNGGSTPGAGTFRIPDKRGRGSIGAVNMGTAQGAAPNDNTRAQVVAGAKGGEAAHLLSGYESGVKPHAHGINDPGHFHSFTMTDGFGDGMRPPLADGSAVPVALSWTTDSKATGITIQNSAEAAARDFHNNIQPYEGDFWIVRVL